MRLNGFNMFDDARRAVFCAVVLAFAGGFVAADDKPSKSAKPGAKKSAADAIKGNPNRGADSPTAERISSKREAAAIEFAQQHHLELAHLLGRLKDSHPDQYAKALRELDRTRERLDKQKEKDAARYAILLREWQLDSRVRLLAARMTMGASAELETELRTVLTERHDVRLQLLTYDRERTKNLVQKMDEQIAEHVQSRDGSIDREVDRIKRNAVTRKKSLGKPAVKRPVEKDAKDKQK